MPNGQFRFSTSTSHVLRETRAAKPVFYLKQQIQSGLGATTSSNWNFNFDFFSQKDSHSDPNQEDMIEVKSLRVQDLTKLAERSFKNIRITRPGFGPSPIDSYFVKTSLMMGYFTSSMSLIDVVKSFDLTFKESEWGIKVGTPAFIYGGIVVNKAKDEIFFDSVIGVFKSREEFLRFLKSNLNWYDTTLTLFVTALALFGAAAGYSLYERYQRRRRRR